MCAHGDDREGVVRGRRTVKGLGAVQGLGTARSRVAARSLAAARSRVVAVGRFAKGPFRSRGRFTAILPSQSCRRAKSRTR
ncbi:hypothetical protein GCM10009830_26610 [Glycomyces endophyticus]|uniref:Uncharacterized protein n=1 Tax=Glycomyces endophyticus TaxID=480996 RepID=A0ABP4SU56_9ACTN